jgi:hypothetical protein
MILEVQCYVNFLSVEAYPQVANHAQDAFLNTRGRCAAQFVTRMSSSAKYAATLAFITAVLSLFLD